MMIDDYIGIGGNAVEQEANEGIADIPGNRTLMVNQMTAEEPGVPEIVDHLYTIEDVFKYFDPNIDVNFLDKEGQDVTENFQFSNVGDFSVKSMTQRSPFLNNLSIRKEFYEKVVKQLRSNKVLQRVIANNDTKAAMLIILKELKKQVEESL
ncbi:hypothetical protein POY80_16735 [Bacteroides uniformis]|uniref:Type VI secretion system contractile sheath small subunit n=3 Tax=Bacteroidaceae TaxID=815 RepID=A0A3E4VYL2_9BACT|nr:MULTISPECIES: hypothetical protein [Bacteroidaceae]KAB5456544.1 hypothetical protein F9001_03095 [Phocaeicola vulgatus]KAB5487854.1 hypothetical protein F9002_02665 [Phocaeicola vulgatus]MCE9212869.1 hypothetical protein [Bacteroides ovatus]MCS2767944.1 hypothetical protein [Bacteroides thetaiotaomicron]MDC1754087.1 hypothetical protein [Bacteroides uniformis]